MKINVIVLLCVLFMQCKDTNQTSTSTVENKNTPIEKENVTNKTTPLVGGFSAMEVTPLIRELASFVLSENNLESPLKEITNASSQIVSGKNYKFDMELEDGKKYTTKVYVNLKNEKEILDFELIE